MPEFLVFFVHRHFDFRYPELEAILTLQGLSLRDIVDDIKALPNPEESPLLQIRLPSADHAKFLSERGILVKGVYEVWGHTLGGEYDALVQAVDKFDAPQKHAIIKDEACSWRVSVDAFGKKLTMEEQHERRNKFEDVLPFAGPVLMRDAQETFLILEEVGMAGPQSPPKQIFFLRELAGSEKNRGRGGARDLVDQQTLKKRAYIGPTSMESEMALLMANMALVQRNDLVIDPFVGTGSVLVPCATHGAICFGTDIDIRVLLGTGVGVSGAGAATDQEAARINVLSNFRQYNLPLPELIRGDNSISPIMTKCANYFDAVVCDPPYGIRAGARRSGRKRPKEIIELKHKKESYIPPTQPYAAEDVMNDLLTFAAHTLREGGRLVYLLPTTYEYTDNDLPRHPSLHVISNSEQKLTKKYARRLITMIKQTTGEPPMSLHEAMGQAPVAATEANGGDASYANLREKIKNKKQKTEDEPEAMQESS
ncbi:TPA: hypothetical protein N0F65_002444 [Lagenidium giganteum]|uniref:tRNA (guanine(10)-N(2))-methyltransferase n=1 Tax=Lagenidium giganteum TaxID=4803 RepID=A0AAV2YJP5_9STRA|nr:TPA: hypothetical protein N0F65_002444 [Lagenidium giganteum]